MSTLLVSIKIKRAGQMKKTIWEYFKNRSVSPLSLGQVTSQT
jgi:hypothetical protein